MRHCALCVPLKEVKETLINFVEGEVIVYMQAIYDSKYIACMQFVVKYCNHQVSSSCIESFTGTSHARC